MKILYLDTLGGLPVKIIQDASGDYVNTLTEFVKDKSLHY